MFMLVHFIRFIYAVKCTEWFDPETPRAHDNGPFTLHVTDYLGHQRQRLNYIWSVGVATFFGATHLVYWQI